MNAVLRVTGEPAAVEAPSAASGTRPTPTPRGGREAAIRLVREALAFHAGKVVDYERLLEELDRD